MGENFMPSERQNEAARLLRMVQPDLNVVASMLTHVASLLP